MTGTTRKHILIVDDNPDILDLFRAALSEEGYRVTTADNGADALLEGRDAQPDLILLDVMLPGLGGFDLIVTFRQDPLTASIPIVVVTAVADEKRAAQARALGADDYIFKPVGIAELLSRVAMALERGHGAGAGP